MHNETPRQLPRDRLDSLLAALRADGHRLIGPQARDGAIVYDDLAHAANLPRGLRDTQLPGNYRLQFTDDDRCFAWTAPAQGLKPWLFAPDEPLWQVHRDADGRLGFVDCLPDGPPLAIVGARACDLAALALLDRHFLAGPYADAHYGARRRGLFIVAVDCAFASDNCFCASTGDGPTASQGYDLALAELDEVYLLRSASEAGDAVLAGLQLLPATAEQQVRATAQHERNAASQVRGLPSPQQALALYSKLQHPHWNEVAERCLACGNCTAVCPTCFCHRELEQVALDGSHSAHLRSWDSCFSAGHSYIHGLTVRGDTRLRYRQWLTHKLAGWQAQYGRSGCVGCGRCITWCPVGIDITAAANSLCQS